MNRLLPWILLGLTVVSTPGAAVDRRPWRPAVTVEPFEGRGVRRERLDPRTTKAFRLAYRQGKRLLGTGRYREARIHLEEAIELNPDHAGARLARARILLTLGYLNWDPRLIDLACQDAEHARRLRPADPAVESLDRMLQSLLERMLRTADRSPPPQKPARDPYGRVPSSRPSTNVRSSPSGK